MFLFIPVIIVIVLIYSAIGYQGIPVAPYDNANLAFIMVFLTGPFLVSFLSYFIQFLISVNSDKNNEWLYKISNISAYIVFLLLLLPQFSPGTGSWLYTALGKITHHFTWIQGLHQEGALYLNLFLLIVKQVLLIGQYYFIFSFYMIIAELFKSLGAKKYFNHQAVGFLSNNRMLVFGFCFVVLTVGLEHLVSYSDQLLFTFATSFKAEYSLLIMQAVSSLLRFAFPVLFLMFFPLVLPLIAGWKPLPEGPTNDLIKKVSEKNNFTYHKVYMAGQPGLLTAGIIGVFPWTRNLMFTKDIINLLDEKEQESVLLHEIGHAKYYHIFTYLLFFMSFSVVIELLIAGLMVLSLDAEISLVLYLLFLISFIYFGWGWLSRQCERQADLNAAEVQGTPHYIISSFLKLSEKFGGILDKPSWHHGSLGIRIQNLEKAYIDNGETRLKFHKSLKRIKISIALFFICVAFVLPFMSQSQRQQIAFKNNLAMSQFNSTNYAGCIKVYEELLSYLKQNEIKDEGLSEYGIIAHYNMACAYSKMKDANNAYNNLNEVLALLTPSIMNYALSINKFATDPDFDYIRDSEWFQNYMKKIKKTKEAFDNKEANPFSKS